MNVLSLFDGISCGQVALERANIKVGNYFASEIDKHAIQVTQKHFPNTKQLGDCQFITSKTFGANKIDLLIGGSPCQSFSRNGDGSGFDGKSKLFWEYVSILNDLKESNPEVLFLLENVMMKKEWEKVITEALGVDPIVIDSKLVSAQKRQRLYWTNIEGVTQPKDKNIQLKEIIQGDHLDETNNPVVMGRACEDFIIKNATKKGYLIAEEGDGVNLGFPSSKTRRGRVAKGKVNTLDTSCDWGVVFNGKLLRLNINEIEALQNLSINYTKGLSDYQRKQLIGNGWTVDVIVHIFKNIKNNNN